MALQHDHPVAGPTLKLDRIGELGVGLLVEAVEITLAEPFGSGVLAEVDQVLDQHAERSPPVTDVVLAEHRVSGELVHPHQGVADHGRAQVPDVHLFGHVRSGVVDDHRAGVGRRGDAEPFVDSDGLELFGQEAVAEGEVDESGAGDLDLAAHVGQHARVEHLLGDLARIRTDLLGEWQRAVDLGVGAIAGTHDRIDIRTTGDLGEYRDEQVGDDRERVGHVRHSGPEHPRSPRTVGGRCRIAVSASGFAV